MKYEERQQFVKKRERQRKEREILTDTKEYQEFINDPTEHRDIEYVAGDFQFRLMTYL
ncbi:MAG: hypothetical protein JJE19_08900 [Methanosarcinales archaeon]|nr:hypothetical protein [Methanosarcinales archaeon]